MSLISTSFCQRLSNDSTNKKRLKFWSRICHLIRLLSVILGWTMYQKTTRLSVSGKTRYPMKNTLSYEKHAILWTLHGNLRKKLWWHSDLYMHITIFKVNGFMSVFIRLKDVKKFLLKTKVNKSKWTDRSQETYVCEKKDNTILNAHWTCRAIFFTVNILN